ncbi:hypothetical protein Tco_0128277 [Tanacetum coccineum]
MQGTSLSKQERECKLYDEFDKFSHVKGETLYEYYLRFAQLINNMNIIQMTMQPVQVNTKFLNSLPLEWGKFVTDVKLARDLHTLNYDKLYAYLEQHEAHANEARLMRKRFLDPLALVANYHQPSSHLNNYHSQYTTAQFKEDKIRMLSVQDHKGMLQEKVLLVQAQAKGKELDEEQLSFLINPRVADGQVAQTITHNAAFQTDDLDAYDSDCDDLFSQSGSYGQSLKAQRIKSVLYDGNVLSKTHDVLYVVDEEETLILAEELNKLSKDFGKHFIPQQELSAEKMFWLQSSNKNSEEPKFDKGLHDEITEVQTVFNQMEAAVEQCSKKNEDFVVTSNKCLELEVELVKKNNVYIELSKRFSNLEQHCISLEVAMQLNKEFFKKDKSCDNQNNPEIQEYFKQNNLKAQLQAKDIVISKLKEIIHSLRDNANPAKVKHDIDEIETINIELEHTQIQEKVFAKAALKNELRKLKGKNVINSAVPKPLATTIAPGMEHADTLREIVESARALSPLDSNLDSACKYVKRIQEVLVYVKDTCPCLTKPSEKLVAVTPKNKDKKVRFTDLVTSSSNTQKQVDSHNKQDSNQPLLHSTGEQKVIEEPGKIRWWEIVWGRPSAAGKDHMIYHMMSLSKQDCDGIPKRPTMYLNLWSYKVVRHRYSNPMIQPEPEGSTQGYPLVSVEVLRKIYTLARNPVKEILLKLNLPDHRILKDGGEDGESRLCLVDDLKVFKITFSYSTQDKGTSSSLKSMITTSNHKLMIQVKDYELKSKDKA